MKKTAFTVLASLFATTLFASPAYNWLTLESPGEDRTLAGAVVPSGTVYSVLHDADVALSVVTDETGWYPASVAQVWNTATGQGYAEGNFAFALFDNAHGEGAIARYLAKAPATVGEVIRLSADPKSPYEIVDANNLTGPILVGPGMTLNIRAVREGYQIDSASTGTIAVDLTADEIERYYADETVVSIPLAGDAFAGTLNLIDQDGETVLPSTVRVVEEGGQHYLKAVKAEVVAGYVDIPFVMTAINELKYDAVGSFGEEEYAFSTNITMRNDVNFKRNTNATAMGGEDNYLWYSTSAGCAFISADHYPAMNARLSGSNAAYYWQIDFPVDFGSRTFNLASARAGYFLCTGNGGWQVAEQKRVVISTLTVLNDAGETVGTLGEGATPDFGYQTVATNTMNAVSAIPLTGKVTLRLKAWFKNQKKDVSYSGCTGLRLRELAGGEYTAMLEENARFGELTWAPRRLTKSADDHLIVKAKADGLTLTLDEAVTCAVMRVTGEGFTTTVDGLDGQAGEMGLLDIDAASAVKIAAWADAGAKLTGAGTLVVDTGAKAKAFAVGSFDSFAGDVVISQGTWAVDNAFPRMTPFAIDGGNAVMTIPGGDKTGYDDVAYPSINVLNGGTLNFTGRDTYSRGLVLSNGGKVVLPEPASGRSLDFFRNSSITVGGIMPCTIGGETAGAANSGVISVRRDNFSFEVLEGATLDVYSQWGYNSETGSLGHPCQKDGAGLLAFYRAPAQTGAFTVNAGTLKLVDAGAPTTGTITMAKGTSLECVTTANVTQDLQNVVLNGASLKVSGAGVVKLPGNVDGATLEGATLDLNGHDLSNLSGNGAVVDSVGTGKLVLDEKGLPGVTLDCRVQFVDGSVIKAPFDSISVNIKGGNNSRPAKAIADANVAGVVPMTGAQWSQVITRSSANAVNGTLDSGDVIYEVRANGTRAPSRISVVPYAACCYTAGTTTRTGNGELMFGYLDDGEKHYAGRGASIDISNIPYVEYTLYVYLGTDQGDSSGKRLGPVYVNGTAYPTGGAWGSPAAVHETSAAIKLVNGENFIKVTGLTSPTLSIVGSKNGSPANTRCGIAGFQLINTGRRIQPMILFIK